MSSPLSLPFVLSGSGQSSTPSKSLMTGGRKSGGYAMRKSQLGARSRWGSAKATPKTMNPWGKAVQKLSTGKVNAAGQSRSRRSTRGSSMAKPTPDSSLWGMSYKRNDPLAWPIESPQTRADLQLISGMTQDKADFNNAIVNKAYQRGGYAG